MAHHDVLDNNPKKELLTTLIGVVLFVVIVAGIAVSAFLRPAGEHPVDMPAIEADATAAEISQADSVVDTAQMAAQADAQNPESALMAAEDTAQALEDAPNHEANDASLTNEAPTEDAEMDVAAQ